MDLTGQVRILPTPGQQHHWSIGAGAFTDVFKGELFKAMAAGVVDARPTYVTVAVKIFRPPSDDPLRTAEISQLPARESSVWVRLNHPNILPYLGHCSNLGLTVALISPFCAGGTIKKYNSINPSADKPQLMKDVANGLSYLHSQNIIHCDLQCNNVLVDELGRAVLANFDRAKVIGEVGYKDTLLVGSAAYMAPELWPSIEVNVNVDDQFSKKSDVYAFGMLCYEIFTNEAPFACYDAHMDFQITLLICQGKRPKRTTQVQRHISANMWMIMEACWVTMPESRPSAQQINQRMD